MSIHIGSLAWNWLCQWIINQSELGNCKQQHSVCASVCVSRFSWFKSLGFWISPRRMPLRTPPVSACPTWWMGLAGAICWDRFFYWKWYRCILIGRYGSFPWITLFRISENGCLGKQNLRHSSRFSMYLETSQTRYEAYQTCPSLLDETEAISIFIKKM